MGQGKIVVELSPHEMVAAIGRGLSAIFGEIDMAAAGDEVKTKSSIGDLVTALDRSLESRMSSLLQDLCPGASIVGEESGGELADGPTWIVDPIDGTTNVVHGVRHAAATVAYLNHGVVEFGVVFEIFSRGWFSAVRGAGAHYTDSHGASEGLNVSSVGELSSALIGFGLPYERRNAPSMFESAAKVFAHCQDLRRGGSAALDLMAVARGQLDAHFELDLRVWDVAAAALIVQEANGRATTWSGEEIRWPTIDFRAPVVVSNGSVHSALLYVLASSAGR